MATGASWSGRREGVMAAGCCVSGAVTSPAPPSLWMRERPTTDQDGRSSAAGVADARGGGSQWMRGRRGGAASAAFSPPSVALDAAVGCRPGRRLMHRNYPSDWDSRWGSVPDPTGRASARSGWRSTRAVNGRPARLVQHRRGGGAHTRRLLASALGQVRGSCPGGAGRCVAEGGPGRR